MKTDNEIIAEAQREKRAVENIGKALSHLFPKGIRKIKKKSLAMKERRK